ncbi:hypothetical protein GYMLUDRAFT_55665 [Collybiopsis luxurians FD-317 M1]|nr:hypothetical protein GYMLUDRAFT_55665 [Collybiopsis luxurians FD-317 M1]
MSSSQNSAMVNALPRPLKWLHRVDKQELVITLPVGCAYYTATTDKLCTILKCNTFLQNYSGSLNNLYIPLTYHLFADRINADPAIVGAFTTLDPLAGTIHVPPAPVH